MRPAWLALLLLLPPAAARAGDTGGLLGECRRNSSSVAMFYDKLSPDDQTGFRRMYETYAAMTKRNRDWTHGETSVGHGGVIGLDLALGNQSTNWRRSFQEYGVMGLFKTALPPESKTQLGDEIRGLEAEFPNASRERQTQIRDRLASLRKEYNLPRGVCEDWAKETAYVVRAAAAPGFRVEWHEIRRGGHAVAFVRHAPTNGCIALDPWPRGIPELTGCEEAEDNSPFNTASCFRVNRPADL